MPIRRLPDVNVRRSNLLTLHLALIALFLLIYHAILCKVVIYNCRPAIIVSETITEKRQPERRLLLAAEWRL